MSARTAASSLIGELFDACRKQGRAAFIPYVMAGDPTLAHTPALLEAVVDGGADVIELGIPYSDPLADGPTIQGAASRALAAGTTFDSVLALVGGLSAKAKSVPLIAFSYFNPVFVRGIERTSADLRAAGFAGAIVPDLPPEEGDSFVAAFRSAGLSLTFLVAPTTPLPRAAHVSALCSDFVYVVSRMGVTGARADLAADALEMVVRLRSVTNKPLAVGFGISTAEQVRAVAGLADGVIVASALIDRAAAAADAPEVVRNFCRDLAAACRR